jgi:hypothetical protein
MSQLAAACGQAAGAPGFEQPPVADPEIWLLCEVERCSKCTAVLGGGA